MNNKLTPILCHSPIFNECKITVDFCSVNCEGTKILQGGPVVWAGVGCLPSSVQITQMGDGTYAVHNCRYSFNQSKKSWFKTFDSGWYDLTIKKAVKVFDMKIERTHDVLIHGPFNIVNNMDEMAALMYPDLCCIKCQSFDIGQDANGIENTCHGCGAEYDNPFSEIA